MTTPKWVRTRCQPIAVSDVLEILRGAVEDEATESRVVEAGGPDVLTYGDMMRVYAEEAGLRRRILIPIPMLNPGSRRGGSASSRRCPPKWRGLSSRACVPRL